LKDEKEILNLIQPELLHKIPNQLSVTMPRRNPLKVENGMKNGMNLNHLMDHHG